MSEHETETPSRTRHEAELRAILAAAIDGIVTIDEHGRIESFNPAAERLFGYRAVEVIGQNVSILMPSPWREEHDDYIRRYLESGRPHVIGIGREVLAQRKDGSRFPCELSVVEVHAPHRRLFTGFVRDLSARNRAREALKRERDFAERLVDLLPTAVVLLDHEGRIIRYNRFLEELTGRSLETHRRLDWFETFIPARDRAALRRRFEERLAGKAPPGGFMTGLECQNGNRPEIEWFDTTLEIEQGRDPWVLLVGLDVTERQRARRRLESQYAVTRALGGANTLSDVAPELLSALTASLQWDAAELWKLGSAAERPERLAAHRRDEEGGEVSFDWHRRLEVLERLARHNQAAWIEADAERAGRDEPGAALAFPVRGPHDHLYAVVLYSVEPRALDRELVTLAETLAAQVGDFVERRRLEAEFRQAQKLEAIGRLAAGIAHDFKNLLMGVRGCATLAELQLDDMDRARELVREIASATDRGIELTRQLLSFSRRQPEEVQPVCVDDAIRRSHTLLQRLVGEDIDLRLDLEAKDTSVLADPGHLDQVLMNLVSNARDAMPHGGTLVIATRIKTFAQSWDEEWAPTPSGRYLELEVSDSGCGMDERTRARAFEPFFTTKSATEGSGLGLSTVYGIARQLGGLAEIESAPGGGTTVRLSLPVLESASGLEAEHGSPKRPRPARTPPSARPRALALVVEDEALVRMTALYFLEELGFETIEAESAERALDATEQAGARGAEISLLLTDMVLPGMSGPELAAKLRERLPSLRTLYMSAYPRDMLIAQGRLGPSDHTIEKPFDAETLAAALADLGVPI